MPSDNDEGLVVVRAGAAEVLRPTELRRTEFALDADLAGELALDRLVREVQRPALDLLGLRLRRVQVLDLLFVLLVLVHATSSDLDQRLVVVARRAVDAVDVAGLRARLDAGAGLVLAPGEPALHVLGLLVTGLEVLDVLLVLLALVHR